MARFMIAAAHKSSGKTVVSTGLVAALGAGVQTFKKGQDYIDPMWLSLASGRPCYSLDFNTMDRDELAAFYAAHTGDLNLIEANKGLYDGVAVDGSDSNAELAKLLKAPVVLVVDTTGTTRGIAPLLMGYQAFDRDVNIAGVILNKTGGARHESKLRAAVETYTDLPVLGAVGRTDDLEIGERHLGLTTPAETGAVRTMIDRFAAIIGGAVDLEKLRTIAASAPDLGLQPAPRVVSSTKKVRIAIARDTAFGFYYPDDLEAFADAGADLVPFDCLSATALPEVDGLFIGGGFPETQMPGLSVNAALRGDIKRKVQAGLPTYAECGGLMYLCENMVWHGECHPMVGVVPGDAVMYPKPQGRGYARCKRTENHPWEGGEQEVRAHEFHYARIENLPPDTKFARTITRGAGVNGVADGIVIHNMLAGFCHLRSCKANPWVRNFVDFVRAKSA